MNEPQVGDECKDPISGEEGIVLEVKPEQVIWRTNGGERKFYDRYFPGGLFWRRATTNK